MIKLFSDAEITTINNLSEPNEIVPWYAYLAATLGKVTDDDIAWAKALALASI